MITDLDIQYLTKLRQDTLKCPKCHGRDDTCECFRILRLATRKIDANIPQEYRQLSFVNFKAPLMRPTIVILKEYVDKIIENRQNGTSLYFYGAYGTGKSALACVILIKALEHGYRCYFTDLDFYLKKRAKQDDKDEDFDIETIRDAAFLVLDNVGAEYRDKNKYVLSSLEELLEYRIRLKLPTILTSNFAPEITFHDSARLVSKIKPVYKVYLFKGKDYRDEEKEKKFASEEKKLREEETKISKETPSGAN